MNDDVLKILQSAPEVGAAGQGPGELETIQVPDISQAVEKVRAPQGPEYSDICPICGHNRCTAWANATPADRAIYLRDINARRNYGLLVPPMFLDDYMY